MSVERQTRDPEFGCESQNIAITKPQNQVPARIQQLALEFICTVLLIGLLVLAALRLWPKIPGAPQRPLSAILVAGLLPIASLVLLSIVERLFAPAGPRKSLRTWLLHLQIN